MEVNKINIETAKVSKWDKIYCELLKKIISEGEIFENRTGIDTLSIEGVNFKLENIEENFPILESKKVLIKNALSEILWIHQAQSNEVKWLEDRFNPIWEEWKIDEDGIYRIYDPKIGKFEEKEVNVLDVDGKIITDKYGNELMAEATNKAKEQGKTIKKAIYYGKDFAGTIGTAYGYINNKYKRPQYVLKQLKENPNDRRMNIILWQDEYIKTGVLPPCVWGTEWKVSNGKLHLYVHQRSADVPLGLPFNVSQYAILLRMFAKASNLEAGSLNYSIMDAHIYVNQIEGINKQLDRYANMNYFESLHNEKRECDVMNYYNTLKTQVERLDKYVKNNQAKKDALIEYKKVLEDLQIFEFMYNKEKPVLEIADKNNFFEFNNNVNNDKEYLKENPTGNKDIKLLNYSSLPFIKMPIAQ